MKLIPKAKPVRIRITSGGIEHNSLESLKKHFVWPDIRELFDGRLDKWLRRINESDIADKLAQAKRPSILDIYNILFKNPFKSAEDVIKASSTDKHVLSLAKTLICEVDDIPIANLLYYYYHNPELASVSLDAIAEKAEGFDKDTNMQLVCSVGKLLYDTPEYKEIGIKCISLSSDQEYQEAIDFKKKYIDLNKDSLYSIVTEYLNKDFIKDEISNSFNRRKPIYIDPSRDENIQLIFKFSNICLELWKKRKDPSISLQVPTSILLQEFSVIDNPMYKEALFIQSLFEPDFLKAKELLEKIQSYYPANVLLINKEYKLNGFSYRPCKIVSNLMGLHYILKNLYKLRIQC